MEPDQLRKFLREIADQDLPETDAQVRMAKALLGVLDLAQSTGHHPDVVQREWIRRTVARHIWRDYD